MASACGSSATISARALRSMRCRSPSCSVASICRRPPEPIACRSHIWRATMRNLLIPLSVLVLAGCKQAPADHAAVTKTEATKIAEQAEANFTTGKADAVMKQYADGAIMIDATHPVPTSDRKVQSGWASDFVSMKPADYHVPDRQIQIVGPDAFISSGTEMFTVAAGNQRPTISARFTDVFQRQKDGTWKIVHEHVSLPPAPPK